jgi:ATP-dependent Clp protease ATP-binding subunit ClpB
MRLEVSDGALDELARAGFDPVYGARPLKRAIQRMIQDPLATRLLQGDFGPGAHVVVDEGKDGNLEFTKGTPPAPEARKEERKRK